MQQQSIDLRLALLLIVSCVFVGTAVADEEDAERQRLTRFNVSRGARLMEGGDMLGALGSPFEHPPNNEGRLVAPATDVLKWLAKADIAAQLVDGDPQDNPLCKQPAD